MLDVNLSNYQLYDADRISFPHKVNFIYGRNGTGKSTLVDIISHQVPEGECRVFQGYEKLLGDNDKLNAVVLGEKNVENDKKIKEKEDKIRALDSQIKSIQAKIERPEDGTSNLWTAREEAKEKLQSAEKEIDHFLSKAASEIKKYNPRVSIATYNKNNLLTEIEYAKEMSDSKVETAKEILRSETAVAPQINFFSKNLTTILDTTNEILRDKAAEHSILSHIETSKAKRDFAKQGLKLHQPGDFCAFCGNRISKKRYEELTTYFSADEIKALEKKRREKIEEIQEYIKQISEVEIQKDNFYPDYQERIEELSRKYAIQSKNIISFLETLEDALQKKDLIESSPNVVADIPATLSEISNAYDEIRRLNNANDLPTRQTDAKNKLRYHLIYKELKEFEYNTKKQNEEQLRKDFDKAEQELKSVEEKITGKDGLSSQIDVLRNEILSLKSDTQNVEILARHINHKLNNLVSFSLEHISGEENGYYNVKNKDTGQLRDIKDLSTGEHNIIAFLYFIEKLDEVDNEESKRKVILFDDPMSSNDDVMQYLMIDELNALEKRLTADDCLIILTHNKHFYLNIKYGWRYSGKDKPKIATFMRLESDNHRTHVVTIHSEEQDFVTNYGELWKELIFLYRDNDALPDMLLNPIRRIIETYTKFNSITMKEFCEKQEGALKLFNVNSHAIDDLEAELNGMTKEEIIKIMEQCFSNVNASNHFNSYWNWETVNAS